MVGAISIVTPFVVGAISGAFARLFGGATTVVAVDVSIGSIFAVIVRGAAFVGACVNAVITGFAATLVVGLTGFTDGTHRFATGGGLVVWILGAILNGRAVQMGVSTCTIFNTLIVDAIVSTTPFGRIWQSTIVGYLTPRFADAITVMHFGAVATGGTLTTLVHANV